MPSGSTISIVIMFHKVAATDGLLVITDTDDQVVGGLVGKVVHAGEPSLAEIVGLAVETHAKVIDIIGAPPFHAAPGLVEGRSSIAHV